MTVLDAAQVQALQDAQPPTDWTKYDAQLSDRSDANENRFSKDDRLHVRFYTKAKYNPDKSAEQNRPIYEDTVYVEIMMPGEKRNIVQRPAMSQRDDLRFPKHFAQFKAGQADQLVGTPLKVLPFLSEAQIEEFAYFKIRTVEQMADLPDSVSFMGAQEYKQKAKKFLVGMSSSDKLMEENADLKKQMAEMLEMIRALQAKPEPEQQVEQVSTRRR